LQNFAQMAHFRAMTGVGCSLLLGFAAASALIGCSKPAPLPARSDGCSGQLVGEIYGGIEAKLDWQAQQLECTGMSRPNGQGARLRFSGAAESAAGQKHLLFILALPGLERDRIATELPTTITVIEEDAGRFFSNRENPVCWTDIHSQALLQEPDEYSISGTAYCVSPLAELNGQSSVSFTDLQFTGQLTWAKPE
jgi:hypothetical protein